MLEMIVIIGITMAISEAIKKKTPLPKSLMFIPVLGLAAGLNALNAYFLNGVEVAEAVAEGIRYGAMAGGVYSLGKEALEGFLNGE